MKRSLTLLLLPLALCAQNTIRLIDGVAAHVNKHVITINEVHREIPGGLYRNLPPDEREARLREVYDATLNAMIDGKLILDEARGTGAQLAAWAVNNRVQDIVDTHFKGDRALLTAELAQGGKTFDEWRKELEEDMLIQYMRYHNVDRTLTIAPKDVRAYYAAHTDEFLAPETVDVSLIIFESFEDDALAEIGPAVEKLLAEDVEFARVAQTLNSDQARALGNVTHTHLGSIFPAEDLRPELAEAVAKIADNGHTPLIIIDEIGYILRRDNSTPARQLPMEEAWPFIENRLRETLARERHQAWVGQLRKKSYVKIFKLPEG